MSFAGVADTHIAIWYLSADPRLSANAKLFIDDAEMAGRKIAISSITIAEMAYLVEKGRIPVGFYDAVMAALSNPNHVFAEAVLSVAVADAVRSVPRNEVPDMPDRIIAATALRLGVPVISRDRRIRSAILQTIW